MKSWLFAALALVAGVTQAQQMEAPQALGRGPNAGIARGSAFDALETPLMAAPSADGSLQQWYSLQKQQAIVVYFDRKLDKMPPGWRGASRLLIEEKRLSGGKQEDRSLTIGIQRNSEAAATERSQFAALFEHSLQQELKRNNFRVLDGIVLHRKLAAEKNAEGDDVEYKSLQQSARFVFEVELICLTGACELIGALKDIRNGEISASVRVATDGKLDTAAEIDRINRGLIRRLAQYKM